MAVVKTTSTLDITLVDDSMYEYVYKINNPKDGVTLSEVRAAYTDVITAGLLYSKNANPITAVARAATVQIRTTTTELE